MLTESNDITESMVDPALRDGYEVHRAALARGMNVTLLPRQVMTVETSEGDQHTFIHGIPQTSTLAGVTYAQDKRMRRALMQRAGFTVPRGATFSVGHSANAARTFADRIGYPVVVKPAIGENTLEVMSGLEDAQQLDEAIEYLRTPPQERPGHARAAYALTELREPDIRRGEIMVPPGYRFLVEEHIHGQYLRLLVFDGRIRSVLLCPGGPWNSHASTMENLFDHVHPSIQQVAIEASRIIPGLPLVAVDMIVPDHRAETQAEDAVIVEYSERPWLAVHATLDPALSTALANEILEISTDHRTAEQDEITVTSTLEGMVEPASLLATLVTECRNLGLVGSAGIADSERGQISTTMRGAPSTIAWLMESLIVGTVSQQRPMFIEERHSAKIEAAHFTSDTAS